MGARETRKEIIEGYFVRQVHDSYFPTYGVDVPLPQAVGTQGDVKKVMGRDAGGVGIGIVGSGGNDVNERRSIVG